MKKILKILLFNFLLIIIFFLIIDITIFYKSLYSSWFYDFNENEVSYIKHITRQLDKTQIEKDINELVKSNKNYNVDKKENSIVLFGCSFVEGISLQPEERIDYKIAKETNCPTYNKAHGGWGTQHALFQLKSKSFYESINTHPQYIIYTYIPDHVNRIHIAINPVIFGGLPTFTYKQGKNFQNNQVETIIYRFPLFCYIKQALFYNFTPQTKQSKFLKEHLIEMKKEIDNHFNKSRNRKDKETIFTIFVYEKDYNILSIANELRKNKIQIIYAEEITEKNLNDINYTISLVDMHPNGKAWDIIAPQLVNHIKNNNKRNENQIEYENKLLKNYDFQSTMFHFNINNLFLFKYIDCHPESINGIDTKLIKEKKINRMGANMAYFFFSIGHLLKTSGLGIFSKPFFIVAQKINKENPSYQI